MGTVSDGVANAFLDALARNIPYSNPAFYLQLHVGAPGSAGTSNPASNTTRMQATFGTAAAARAISNTTAPTWTSVPTLESYTHVSAWSASSGGNYLGQDDLSSPAPVNPGDNFVIPIGDLDLTIT